MHIVTLDEIGRMAIKASQTRRKLETIKTAEDAKNVKRYSMEYVRCFGAMHDARTHLEISIRKYEDQQGERGIESWTE